MRIKWILAVLSVSAFLRCYGEFRVSENISWFPVSERVVLGMNVDDFRDFNSSAKTVINNEFKSDGARNPKLTFIETVEGDAVEVDSERLRHYFFLESRLVRVAWKDSSKDLGLDDARKQRDALSQNFKLISSEPKYFFGGSTKMYTAQEDVFETSDGVEIRYSANEHKFSSSITDVTLLGKIGQEGFFETLTDDHAIRKFSDREGVSDQLPLEPDTSDYILEIRRGSGTGGPKPNNENRTNPREPKANERSVSKETTAQSEEEKTRSLPWLYWILGSFILGGVGVLVWNSRKGSSAS